MVDTLQDQLSKLESRVRVLESELSRAVSEREVYRSSTVQLLNRILPLKPPTPDEIHEMLNGPRGVPVLEQIQAVEREIGIPS